MTEASPESIDSIVAAIAEDARIHWDEDERATLRRTGAGVGTTGSFRALTAPSVESAGPAAARSRLSSRVLVGAWAALVALTGLKAAIAAGALAVTLTIGRAPAPLLPFAVNVVLFGLSGALLVIGASRDRRVRLLGAFFLFIAAAFAAPLLPTGVPGALGIIIEALRALPMDAFLPLSLWLFARVFPSEAAWTRARRVADGFVLLSALIGAVLFTANVWLARGQVDAWPTLAAALRVLDRAHPTLAYWPLLFALAIAALPYLVWKVRHETVEVRQRGAVFVMALVLGITPMLVTVIATPFVPALQDPSWRSVVGWVLYGALISIIPSTAYAVIVGRVMDVQFVLRKTSQHALARYVVWLASVGPLGYLFLGMFLSRGREAPDVWSQSTLLFVVPLAGFGVLMFREQLLRGVDTWFLRGPVDYAEALARVEHGLRQARGVREIATTLVREIERALHPDRIAVFAVDEERGQFVALAGACPPLSTQSVIVDLLRQVRCGIQIHVEGEGPIGHLLSPEDRDWLVMGRITLMCPLVDSTGALLGLVGVGESRGGLPYSKQDRMFITAISGHAAIQIENRRLQEFADDGGPRAGRQQQVVGIDWDNEPGAQCQTCWMVWPGNVRICSCHTTTVPAALPFVVKGKFRVEKLIGSGGMGVVYQAVDMTLDRKVAIKTLPEVTPDRVVLLQREARAMASVLHPNLALIFGVEQWRGTPLLIVECLDGGMLSDYLRQGALDVPDVIDLGIVLADVLDRVHASGVLHRDIKPSNIAYTNDGIVKLLDFGVAVIVDRSMRDDEELPAAMGERRLSPGIPARARPFQTIASSTQRLFGTPLYLSPEAIAGHTPDASFDLWSLSLVLYESLTGVHPLNGDTVADVIKNIQTVRVPDVRDFRPSCPAELAALLGDCLSPHIVRRAGSARELRLRLQRLRATLAPPS